MVLQARSFATVSTLGIPASAPAGSAESITNAIMGKFKAGRVAVLGAATTGFFTYSENCGSIGGNSPNLGFALGGAALGSVPVVGGALQGLFGAFTGHHAQAVKNEQATLCRAVPDANNFLRSIDALVQSGQLDPASAVDAMQRGFEQWRSSEIAPILKDSGGKCNAACVYEKCFQAAIEKRKLDYASASVQNTRGANGAIGGAVNLLTGAPASSYDRGVTPLYSGAPVDAPAYVGGVPSGIVSGFPGAPALSGGIVSAFPQNSGVLLIGALFVVVIGSAIFLRRK